MKNEYEGIQYINFDRIIVNCLPEEEVYKSPSEEMLAVLKRYWLHGEIPDKFVFPSNKYVLDAFINATHNYFEYKKEKDQDRSKKNQLSAYRRWVKELLVEYIEKNPATIENELSEEQKETFYHIESVDDEYHRLSDSEIIEIATIRGEDKIEAMKTFLNIIKKKSTA